MTEQKRFERKLELINNTSINQSIKSINGRWPKEINLYNQSINPPNKHTENAQAWKNNQSIHLTTYPLNQPTYKIWYLYAKTPTPLCVFARINICKSVSQYKKDYSKNLKAPRFTAKPDKWKNKNSSMFTIYTRDKSSHFNDEQVT